MTIFCPNGHENPDSNRFCQSCGSPLVAPVNSAMTVGVTLGDRYRITKEIGQGGFGRTYLCEDVNRFNEPCVLKEFAPQVHGTALLTKAQQLFEREAGVMYQLQHPQIPMFREMFRVNRGGVGLLFLVQDYVAGENYQQLLRQKTARGHTFTEAEITKFLIQILPVLSYIHSVGVIHRDISPDNLISRASDGLPVLIDFGGVKQVAVNAATQYMPGNVGNSEVPTRLGKIGYAPNEQMQRGVVFPHSDLYALAATSLVLLTGKEPPDLIDPQNFTWNWREHISLNPNLGSILDRMLQLRPNDRFESAQDVLTALQSGKTENLKPTVVTAQAAATQTAPGQNAQSQIPTVVVTPNPPQIIPPTLSTKPKSSLMAIVGKTWMTIAAVVGAIGLGWLVASLMPKRSESPRSPNSSIAPVATPSQTSTRSIEPTTATTSITPTIPAALTAKGVNIQAYGDAVKQVYGKTQANNTSDSQAKSQLDTIASELGDKLDRQLSTDAVKKIGTYTAADRSSWESQINKLHLSKRTLIDLTNAKYRSITDYSADKLGLKLNQFLNTPIGQIYQATMFDRVQAIASKQATDEIVFPIGGNSGTVSGTLQPGDGKAYVASLVRGQDIAIDLQTNSSTKLSIYPPTSKLPAILTDSQTKNWSGKTTRNGYHEFVLVSDSDLPIQYSLKLTASDLPRKQKSSNRDLSPDKEPLW
ncbi:serine/threonine-protein kinase [Chamaesiphon sp. VAR_48_metabat_403]|uniref:serine/threonine-protein kinase n=1 Tax=Chamaesiphon sp. VAR_48_metabat_403 TaxID=2964700 RepID=UPI00286E21C0|nr:serine/threonine-protein kinase [Chamaesiphon sp. VAR_48_metabat_403]